MQMVISIVEYIVAMFPVDSVNWPKLKAKFSPVNLLKACHMEMGSNVNADNSIHTGMYLNGVKSGIDKLAFYCNHNNKEYVIEAECD